MSARAARWPRLKLGVHPVLDWVETAYSKAQLLEIADAVDDRDMPAIPVKGRRDKVWNNAIVGVLRVLAANKEALKTLNHRRPKVPARVVALNRAVHVHVLIEMHPERKRIAIWTEVAKVWGVSGGQVKDDVSEYRALGTRWRPDNAQRLMIEVVTNVCSATKSDPAEVLRDFDADLRDRAQQLRITK